MKKLFISLMTVGALLASCANFDEPTAKTFADGPSVDVKVDNIADSTFTFTVTPASGANYYTYVVCEGEEVENIDGDALLKDQVSGLMSKCQSTKKDASVTVNMRDASNQPLAAPNSSYVVYAVAGSADGVAGKVTAVQVKTTDKVCPSVKNFNADDNVLTLVYDNDVVRSDGKISAQYYIEWEDKFVDIPEEDITVDVTGCYVTLSASNIPANCYVLFTLETGAFKDMAGNNSDADGWGISQKTGAFTGLCYQQTADVLAFDASNIVSPTPGTLKDATEPIVINFGQDVYVGSYNSAVISVIYKGTGKTTTYDVTEWTVHGQTLSFNLPETPAEGDIISFEIPGSIVADKYGNENVTTALANVYKYSTVAWKQIGTYTYNYSIFWNGPDTQKIYQNEANPSQYKMENWGGGVDFIFNVAEDGTITFDSFNSGYLYTGYGDVWVYDMNSTYGSSYSASKYDSSTGVYSFNLYYNIDGTSYGWYDDTQAAPETMTISTSAAKAIAKARTFKASKIVAPSKKNFHILNFAK